jgi:hypothetical protein
MGSARPTVLMHSWTLPGDLDAVGHRSIASGCRAAQPARHSQVQASVAPLPPSWPMASGWRSGRVSRCGAYGVPVPAENHAYRALVDVQHRKGVKQP